MEDRDLTIEEMIQIGTQLFPDADPQQIADAIDQIKAESPETTNGDILNMVIHMVVDKKEPNAGRLGNLRELIQKR